MKRIEFIAPVEAIRGNMSGKQTLVYAENDNRAFEAPEGVQYAKNYSPRFIGAKRAKDGLKYFSVKCKSATKIDANSLRRMAAMGATSSAYGADGWGWPLASLSTLQANYLAAKEKDPSLSLRKYAAQAIYSMYENKRSSVIIGGPNGAATAGNPFVKNATNTLGIEDDVFQKFFPQLAVAGTHFEITGVGKGIAWVGNTFAQIIADPKLNVLGLTDDGQGNVKIYGKDLTLDGEETVGTGDTVTPEGVYRMVGA